jgi:hypothetical protein
MARNAHKLVTAAGEVVGRSGKLRSIQIAVTGDRVWNLRQTDVSGNILYKLSTAINVPHDNLDLGFKTALFAEVDSGTTGELNVVYE